MPMGTQRCPVATAPLFTECVIHALSTDAHDRHQFFGGRGGKALSRKKFVVPSKVLSPDRIPSVEPCSFSLSVFSFLLCNVSAVDGEAGSGDETRFFRCEVGDEASDLRYVAHSLQRNKPLD